MNEIYRNVHGVGRVKTSAYIKYIKQVKQWSIINSANVNRARIALSSLQGHVLRVDRTFYVERSQVFTKKNTPKRNDVTNRIKALDDVLAELLCIDDSLFWSGFIDRKIAPPNHCNFVMITFQLVPISNILGLKTNIIQS